MQKNWYPLISARGMIDTILACLDMGDREAAMRNLRLAGTTVEETSPEFQEMIKAYTTEK